MAITEQGAREFLQKMVQEQEAKKKQPAQKTPEELQQGARDYLRGLAVDYATKHTGADTISQLLTDIQGLRVPTVAESIPKTTGGYYSRPVADTSGVEGIQQRLNTLSDAMQYVRWPVEKAEKEVQAAEAVMQDAGTRLENAYKAYTAAPTQETAAAYNQAVTAYKQAKTGYESSYNTYTTAYDQYQKVAGDADKVFSAWKKYATDSQTSYDAWKSTIRDAGVVKQELDAVEAQIKELEPIPSGLMDIFNLLGNAAANAAASSSSLGPVPSAAVAESPELAKLKAQRELLQEEYDWAVHSDQTDIRSTPYFGSLSEQDRLMVIDMTEIQNMTASDKAKLENWLISKRNAPDDVVAWADVYGWDRLKELESSLRRYQNQQSAQETLRKAQDAAQGVGGGIWTSLASVGANVWNAITSPLSVAQELLWYDERYGNLDPNGPGFKASVWSGAVRDTVGKNIAGDKYDEEGNQTEDGGWLREGASMLYGAGMSAADNLARLAVGMATGGGSAVTLGLAATGSFGDTVRQISAQGGDPMQALAMGVISGGLEVLTEKYSVENLLKVAKGNPLNFKNTLKEMVKQGAIEVSEEEINFLASTLAEAAIMQDKSAYNLQIKELVSKGMSEAEARKQANLSLIQEAGETAVQSFLSGGMMTGAVSTVNNARFSKLGQKLGLGDLTLEDAQAIIDSGLESAEDTEAYQIAQNLQKKLDAGKVPTKSELAQQLSANEKAIQTEKYSIDNTKNMPWSEQIEGALYGKNNIRRNDTLIACSPADTLVADAVKNIPLAIPQSILTKAQKGKDISHSIKKGKLARLDEGIKKAPIAILNPERNAIVYVTDIKQGGLPIVASFDMENQFDGDYVHKATSIHLQVDVGALLSSLPKSATVYAQKNELDRVVGATNNLRGLAAQIKFVDEGVTQTSAEGDTTNRETNAQSAFASPSSEIIIDQGGGIVNPGAVEGQAQTRNELYRQMVQQNNNGGNVNVETRNDAGTASGNLVHDGGQGWDAGAGTGEPVGGLAEGAEIAQSESQSRGALAGDQSAGIGETAANRSWDSRIKDLQSLGSRLALPRVSSLSLGVPEGTEKNSVRVLPRESWNAPLQAIAQNVQQETGLPVTFVLGSIPVKNRRSGVRAVYTPTGIIIQVDNIRATPQQLADHETYHFKADAARHAQLNQRVAERLLEKYSMEELSRMLDQYKENLAGLVEEEGLTEGEFFEAFSDAVLEEFLADAYAGINAFGVHADRYQTDVEAAMDGLYMGKARNQDNGVRQTNGPNSVKYSVADGKITKESTEEERYEILRNVELEIATPHLDRIGDIDLQDYNTRRKSDVEPGLKALAKKLGITNVDLKNSHIDFPFQFSGKGLHISLHHQLEYGGTYQDYVLAMSCFNGLIENAVPIEVHGEKKVGTKKENTDLKQTIVLVSAFRNGKSVTPVEMEVKEYVSRDSKLYMTVVLTKIEPEVLETSDNSYAEDPSPLVPGPTISLQDIFSNVNPGDKRFLKYVPDGFLNEEQKQAKQAALDEQKKEYEGYGKKDAVTGNGEEWVSWENFSMAEVVQAQVEGRYDNETRMVRVPKPVETTDTQKANSQAVEKTKAEKSKFSADDTSAMEQELEMRQSQSFQDRLMEDGGSAAWVANQKRIEVLRQKMKRDPETIQKRNERDLQTEGTEPAKVRVPKKKDAREPAPVSKSKPILAKQDLRKNLLHFFSVPEGQRQELGVVIDGYADRLIRNGALTEEDRRRFFDRMYAAGVMEVPADEVYSAGRELLRGGRIYVNDSIRAEFGDDWQDFRRQAFAAGVYLTNNPHDGGVDHVNSYMADYLPSLFDSEETDLRMALERIVQVAEEGKSQQVSLAEYTAQLAGEQHVPESEFLDAMERHLDWALRTFAEKAELEVKLRDRTGVKIAQEREAAEQSRYKQSAREEARRLRERKNRMELREQQRQEKELRELQQKTLKSLQWLSKNRQRASEELRETWDEVLGDIDLFAVSAAKEMRWSDRYGATWKDLAEMYQEAKEKDPNFMPSKDLERIVSRLNDKKIGEMDIGALQDLYKAAVGLQKEFHNRNNVINDEMNRMFEEVYEDSKAEIEGAPGGYKGKFMDKLFNMQQLTPMNVLQRMGGWNPDGTFFSMAKQLERGERDVRAYTVKANRILEDFLTEYEDWVKKCDGQGKDGIWYELEVPEVLELNMGSKPIFGDTFKVYFTPAQKVHMYLESKNPDNLRHMLGGRTFADKKLYSEGKRQEALSQGRTVRLAPETVKVMVSELTGEERALADVLEKYYNTFAKEEINRVSNALYGYDKAMGKNYAPIFNNKNYTKSELGIFDETAEGVGHMKGRIAYSKNPSYNISALDAFERHVDQTARFTGMSIPARNWNTLLNWREKNSSTGDVITHKWGEESKKYIEGIIEDIQSGKRAPETGVWSQLAEKALRNYISAVFGANPSIVLKQMGSVPMAAPYLDFRNFPTLAQIKNIDRDLIAKYTQELAWRTMGYATPETKELKDNPNWTQTNKPVRFVFGGGAITAMDGWAASTLWPWAENKVRRDFPDLEAGTDAYYKKVAEEFEYAMSRSQSVSDEIHQSILRKSRNPVDRLFTMFRSDSAQTYNTIRQKIGEARYYKRIGADKKTQQKANKAVGTAFVASLSGLVWAEGISLIVALWKNKGKKYRDDEDELTAESIMGEAAMNLVSSMAGTMIGGEELAGILGNILMGEKWYDLETPGMEQLNEIINALTDAGGGVRDIVTGAWEIAQDGGDVGKYLEEHAADIAGGVKELAETVAKYFAGVPVANVEAYLLGLFKWVTPELTTAYEDALSTAEKAGVFGLTGDALEVRVGNIMEQRGVDSDVATETLASLYEEGYSSVVPGAVPSKVTIKKEEKELNAYQKQVYGNIWGSIVAEYLEGVVSSELFADADAKIQSELIQALYSYADAKAKAELFDEYTLSGSINGMDDALKSGLSMEKVLDLKVTREKEESGTGAQGYTGKFKDYMEMVENGVNPDEAHGLIMHQEELEPMEGEDQVTDVQKWRMCVDLFSNPAFQLASLATYMSDSQFKKAETAERFDVDLSSYVKLYEIRAEYDENENKSFSNAEYKKAIDSLHLSTHDSAVLWQLATGTKSAKNNPYSSTVGQKVIDALED